jgi:nucleotide-binding universal stress UspA family protein
MFKDVLLPLDLGRTAESEVLFARAAEVVATNNARLHVLSVVPEFGLPLVASFFPPGFEEKALEQAKADLKTFTDSQSGSVKVAQHIVGHGSVYKEIVRIAEETKCDLVIMGQGEDVESDYLLGHNSARVMRHSHCSVLLLR